MSAWRLQAHVFTLSSMCFDLSSFRSRSFSFYTALTWCNHLSSALSQQSPSQSENQILQVVRAKRPIVATRAEQAKVRVLRRHDLGQPPPRWRDHPRHGERDSAHSYILSSQVRKTCQFWLLTFWLLTFWLLTVPSALRLEIVTTVSLRST